MKRVLQAIVFLIPLLAFASRWTDEEFTTAYIAANSSLVIDQTISSSIVDIGKIKVVPETASGTTLVQIYKEAACTTLVYSSGYKSGNIYDPTNRVNSVDVEGSEGFVVPYEDLDGTSKLHIKITNKASISRRFTVNIYYEVPTAASQIYPAAGVPLSTGTAWSTSYTVGTSANNLVQLNASSQLPAVDGSLLTNLTSSMVYPGAGVPLSSGSAWSTSYAVNGNGSKVQLFTGTTTTAHCAAFDANGNIVDDGAECVDAKDDIGLGNVENTALSTWAGSANITTLGTIGNQTTFTKGIVVTPASPLTVAGSGDIATDASLSNYFRVTLTTDCPCTLTNPTNPADGMKAKWEVIQASGGSESLAYDTAFAFGAEVTGAAIPADADKHSFIEATYNSTAGKWYVTSFLTGY